MPGRGKHKQEEVMRMQNRVELARKIHQLNQPETAADRRTICDAILNNAQKDKILAMPQVASINPGVRLMIVGARI